jgi:predicted ribosome-associated RNA-binding protein Tma20
MSTGILAPTTIVMEIEGVLTTSLVAKVALPFNGTITGAMAVVSTSATGSALNFTLVNGAVNAGAFSIAAGAEVDEATLTVANCKFNKGDIIAVTIEQIGSDYAGKDLTIAFTVTED